MVTHFSSAQQESDPESVSKDASLGGPSSRMPLVAVLLCTYNGERFLKEQLDSIERQTHSAWIVAVSDDGSTDSTLEILQDYRKKWGEEKLTIFPGPKRGFAANFMSLTCLAGVESDFYAWADQDDIWLDHKLQTALDWLQTISEDVPALYCGRTELINENCQSIGFSPLFRRPATFSNALVQSIGGGNTMVFNHAALKLIREAGKEFSVVSHDWWAYLAVTGVGGRVFYDAAPTILYRQHNDNIVGSNSSLTSRVNRLRMVFEGRFRCWNQSNIRALESIDYRLSEENRSILNSFKEARAHRGLKRFLWLRRSGVYRQTVLGHLGLILAAIFNGI